MSSSPLQIPLGATADVTGAATITPTLDFRFAVFSVALTVAGSSPAMQVLVNGTPYLMGAGANPTIGPIFSRPGDRVDIKVTGATPSSTIAGLLQGEEADTFDELDPGSAPTSSNVVIAGGSVTLAGPATITGPVTVQQSDPTQLLHGAVGTPVLENGTASIPANGHTVLGPYNVAGFGGVLFVGAPNIVGNNAVHCQMEWLDGSGNTIAVGQAVGECVDPWAVAYATLGQQVKLHFWNLTASPKSVQALTLIPLAQLPPALGTTLFGLLATPSSLIQTPNRQLLGGGGAISVPASSATVLDGSQVYSGPAMWVASNDTGITANSWWAELRARDASNTLWSLARAGNVAQNPPMRVILPPLHLQVSLHNTAASALNLFTMLYAE